METQLFPKTFARVHFRAEATLTSADFAKAVRRSGYVATHVEVEPTGP